MPKHRGMKLIKEFNWVFGEDPEYGAIFMSNSSTRKECLRRELFGLPIRQAEFVKQVKVGMLLFLFDFETRELHGVFQACSDGAINIDPNAFCSSGKQFPAQVKFTEKWRCMPLCEREFGNAIRENYFMPTKFNFGLSKAQVQRLLKLFSLTKVEISHLRTTSVAKRTRKSETGLGNTADNRGFGNHCAEETNGDVDCDFPSRAAFAGDLLGRRLTHKYCLGDESDIGVEKKEYSRDASGVCRRLVDPELHGSKDRLGYDLSMNNNSTTDALTNYSDYSIVNYQRVPKNLRDTESGWLNDMYHEKDGITHASSWSSRKGRLNPEAGPVVPAQNSVPLESPYGKNTGYYDPYEPEIMGDPTMKSSRHDRGASNADLMGSASFTANSNQVLREEIIHVGGYGSDALPSGTVQPFPDEHNDTSMNKTSSLGLDYYIPMPVEHREFQANIGIIGVSCSESESRNGRLCHSQFPGLSTSARVIENIGNFERLPYSSRDIFPSFAYPFSSRNLSPRDGVNNEITAYPYQEEFGGYVSSNDRVIRDSRIYPSFTYPSRSGDEFDLYQENGTQNKGQAYEQHGNFEGDALDFKNRVIRIKDRVEPVENERKRTRKSVFSRLALPSKERDAEKVSSPDTESVDEVMAFLNDYHKHWMEQKRPNIMNSEGFGKPKKKKEKIHTKEVLDNDLTTETSPDDLLGCEESMEHSDQKRQFIDFKRRSKAGKSSGIPPTQGCKDIPEHSALWDKKRKLLRPKLIEDDSKKDGVNNDNLIENDMPSKSATEVPLRDLLGRGDQ